MCLIVTSILFLLLIVAFTKNALVSLSVTLNACVFNGSPRGFLTLRMPDRPPGSPPVHRFALIQDGRLSRCRHEHGYFPLVLDHCVIRLWGVGGAVVFDADPALRIERERFLAFVKTLR